MVAWECADARRLEPRQWPDGSGLAAIRADDRIDGGGRVTSGDGGKVGCGAGGEGWGGGDGESIWGEEGGSSGGGGGYGSVGGGVRAGVEMVGIEGRGIEVWIESRKVTG